LTENSYLDSNVFILVVLGERSQRAMGAGRALTKMEAGEFVGYTSTLTWDEVVWAVTKVLGKADGVQAGRKLLNYPGLRFLDVTSSTISKAQAISETLGVAPRDSIHCAAALLKGIGAFVSDDVHFDRVPELKRVRLESFNH
jgi:predicted nucleic acid-binding protein